MRYFYKLLYHSPSTASNHSVSPGVMAKCTNSEEVITVIDSVKNPIAGRIEAKGIGEIILDDKEILAMNTQFSLKKEGEPLGV